MKNEGMSSRSRSAGISHWQTRKFPPSSPLYGVAAVTRTELKLQPQKPRAADPPMWALAGAALRHKFLAAQARAASECPLPLRNTQEPTLRQPTAAPAVQRPGLEAHARPFFRFKVTWRPTVPQLA
eukprot:6195734-Pleurochrysis_carterae.AAC.1